MIFFALLAGCCSSVNAAFEEYINKVNGSALHINTSLEVKDEKFQTSYWPLIEKNLTVNDIVLFEIDDEATTPLTQPFTCKIDLQIVSYNSNNLPTTILKTLRLNFDPTAGKTYLSSQAYKFINAHHMMVTVQSIAFAINNIPQPPPPIFTLQTKIQVNRIYKFDCNLIPDPEFADTANGFLEISWLKQPGAESYDLEWTFLDDSSRLIIDHANALFSDLFKLNATRISTAATSYRLRRAYSSGYIYFRVRGVHFDKNHRRQNGTWSGSGIFGSVTSFSDAFWNPDLSKTLNWQYDVSFAEEGKKLENLSYHDGTLRNRQAIGYDNSNQKALISETFYDHIGRAAVQAMPVPDNDSSFAYRNLFNTADGIAYNYLDWETGNCSSIPSAMDSASGAARYYSSVNTDTLNYQKFLPRAYGFPFSVIEYTPDMTGRISRQGGIGRDHQPGLHDTKYFYGKPEQKDLDRIFGNDAGISSHYLKNLAIDRNGQISISYLDAHGRTIATALAGEAPSNQTALSSNTGAAIETYELLDNNQLFNCGKINTHKLLATNHGKYQFEYEVTPAVFQIACDDILHCYNGYYDLKIMITDDCMNSTMPNGVAKISDTSNYLLNGNFVFDTTCAAAPALNEVFELDNLSPGGYNIEKTLTVSEAAVNFYTEQYLRTSTCLIDSQTFIQQAIASIDFSGCDISCEECFASVGEQDVFIEDYLALLALADPLPDAQDTLKAFAAYTAAIKGCEEACNGKGNCNALIGTLKSDVLPGHQWAQFTIDINGNYLPKDDHSALYYFQNVLYFDDDGSASYVYYNGSMVAANTLPLKNFILSFRPSWTNSLVIYHPEYCYYSFCLANANSNAYDDQMMRISSFEQANSDGYLKPVPGNTDPYLLNGNNDPFFLTGNPGEQYASQIQNELIHYVDFGNSAPYEMSAWDFSMATVNSINNPGALPTAGTSYSDGCTGDKNAAWIIFRSIYHSLKFKYLDLARETFVMNDNNGPGNGLGCHSNLCMTRKYDPDYLGSLWSSTVTADYCASDPYNEDGYVPRVFHFEAGLPVGSGTIPDSILYYANQYATMEMDSFCKQSCEQQAGYWLQQLSGCDMDAAQEAAIRDGLIEVCMAGCDASHPFGASTTPDGVLSMPNGYKSFEEVIQMILNVLPTEESSCNALMIGSPGQYNTSMPNNGYLLYTKDECVCAKFNALQDSFYFYGGYPDLASFINAHYSSNLSADEVSSVLSMCNDPSCNYLAQPIIINMALSCDNSECKTCGEYEAAKFFFSLLFPENDFSNYETFFANYMNQQFGFNLLYSDYLAFEQACNDTVKKDYVIADTANTIVTTFTLLQGLQGGVSVCFENPENDLLLLNKTMPVDTGNILMYLDTSFVQSGINYQVIDSILIDSSSHAIHVNIRNKVYQDGQLVATTNVTNAVPCNCEPGEAIPLLPVNSPKLCGDQHLAVTVDTVSCHDQLINMAITNGLESYHDYIDSVAQSFAMQYRKKALEAVETFTVSKPFNEYHYTLYYYDQAGNLVKTIPPSGITLLNEEQLIAVQNHRTDMTNTAVYPTHSLASRYWYNSLNAPVKQLTPDADSARFWYDRLGRVVVSQRAQQRSHDQYSYTIYDALGRITQAGMLVQSTIITNMIAKNPEALASWISGVGHFQVTTTFYDVSPVMFDLFPQSNLRNRVACIVYEEMDDGVSGTYQCATYFDYDVSGNVKAIRYDIQELANFNERFKRIDYEYDLVTGKVNRVYYQRDSADQFIYQYRYDAMNRLIAVLTSKDGFIWETDAGYEYYDHGPLARMELGNRQVQGVDYAYTIQGWLKGINSLDQNNSKDMGRDAVPSGVHSHMAQDVYGVVLGYFSGDYSPIGKRNFEPGYATSSFGGASPSLYNGNIRNMGVSVATLPDKTIGYAYHYDQLNRLTGMDAYNNFNAATYNWSNNGLAMNDWKERVSYDANGNILTYIRHGNDPLIPMDSMTYSYNTASNQLNHVDDGVAANSYADDIDDQSTNNYAYDKSGNLIKDVQEGLTISWNAYDKIAQVQDADSKQTINFRYDASGNRLVKQVMPIKKPVINTYYIRDAQGNILATYHYKHPVTNIFGQTPKDTIWWEEQHLYGTSRIGIDRPGKIMFPSPPLLSDTATLSYYSGLKNYELTNHLGNVLAVVNDKRIGVDDGSGGIAYYKAEMVMAGDYYTGGMVMPGRILSSTTYQFGYQGSLKDDDVKGRGNLYATLFRQLDPRINQWWSVDPDYRDTPCESPYASMSNNPALLTDVLGNSANDWVRGKNGKLRYDSAVKKPSDVNSGDTYIGTTLPIFPIPIGYNLFPNSIASHQYPTSEPLNNQSQNQTVLSQTLSVLPLKNVQIYSSLNLKLNVQTPNSNSKMVIPIGIQAGIDNSGPQITSVTPLINTYFSYGIHGFYEARAMPGQSNVSAGEYIPFRGLATFWMNGLIKIQGEISSPSITLSKLQIGGRLAVDQPIIQITKNTSLSFEGSVGVRGTINPKSPIFWTRSFVKF